MTVTSGKALALIGVFHGSHHGKPLANDKMPSSLSPRRYRASGNPAGPTEVVICSLAGRSVAKGSRGDTLAQSITSGIA